MKYVEFLKLSEILESQGTTILKEFKLNEAPDTTTSSEPTKSIKQKVEQSDESTIDTITGKLIKQKGNIFLRWGRIKMKLNKQAEKVQAGVLEKIVKKYLPAVLEGERTIAQQIVNAKKTGENTDQEILELINKNLINAKDKRQKQLQIIDTATNQYIKNAENAMNNKIDDSKMTDKNKLNLKNYWLLLLTQIRMNVYAKMAQLISEDVKKIFGEDAASVKIYQALENEVKVMKAKQAEVKKTVDAQAAEIKELQKQFQSQTTEPEKQVQTTEPEKSKSNVETKQSTTQPTP